MDSALIISPSEKGKEYFSQILAMDSFEKIVTVTSAGDARRLLIEKDFDICIIDAPLKDEYGEKLAQNIATKGISGVILCVKAEIFDEVTAKVEDYGVITVSRPFNRSLFWNALKLSKSSHRKMQQMQHENTKLVQKIEDIRIIDRAKCVLIYYLSMSEEEAHHYIEKQAMDTRLTKREIAERILKTYEN